MTIIDPPQPPQKKVRPAGTYGMIRRAQAVADPEAERLAEHQVHAVGLLVEHQVDRLLRQQPAAAGLAAQRHHPHHVEHPARVRVPVQRTQVGRRHSGEFAASAEATGPV